jgi:hypothetical protein
LNKDLLNIFSAAGEIRGLADDMKDSHLNPGSGRLGTGCTAPRL